jgi:hypothetical protein
MFFTFSSTTVGNGTLTCNDPCAPGKDYPTVVRNDSWDNAHTSDPSNRGERLGEEPNILVQLTQHTIGSSNG